MTSASDTQRGENVAIINMTFIAAFFVSMIAIVSLRWSFLVPCVIFVYFGWLNVTQREWLAEMFGHDANGSPTRSSIANEQIVQEDAG